MVALATWVLPFCSSRICVLVGLPLTTKVPLRPAAMLAPLRPTMSRLTSTRWPCRVAKLREVAALWAMMRTKHEKATPSSCGTSDQPTPRAVRSAGSRPASARRSPPRATRPAGCEARMIDRMTATIAPGTFGTKRLKPRMIASVPRAKASVGQAGVAQMGQRRPLLLEPAALSLGDPEHVGQLAGEDLDAHAGEEADQHRGGQEVAEEPQPQQSGEHEQDAAHERGQRGQGEPLRRVRREPGDPEGGEATGEDRCGGGVGTDDEEPGRAEQREDERREENRVETGDHRHLGDRGVAHGLGDGHRREGEPRDDVRLQPRSLVATQRLRSQPGRAGGPIRTHVRLPSLVGRASSARYRSSSSSSPSCFGNRVNTMTAPPRIAMMPAV